MADKRQMQGYGAVASVMFLIGCTTCVDAEKADHLCGNELTAQVAVLNTKLKLHPIQIDGLIPQEP